MLVLSTGAIAAVDESVGALSDPSAVEDGAVEDGAVEDGAVEDGTPEDEEVRRTLTLLNVVAEEYREGVVDGVVVVPVEYEEAKVFLDEAQQRLERAHSAAARRLEPEFSTVRRLLENKGPLQRLRDSVERLQAAISASTGVTMEVFPAAAPSAERGRYLYRENCVSCHGDRADGGGPDAADLEPRPANFTDAAFMRAETPFDFFNVITVGRRSAAMPAWGDVLSLQDRWDLVSYLWTVRLGVDGLAEGQGVYLANCAGCHAGNGDGRGPLSAGLLKPPGRLDQLSRLSGRSDGEIHAVLADGIAGSPMPGYSHLLDERGLWGAVAFTRFLSMGAGAGLAGEESEADRVRRFAGLLRLLSEDYQTVVTTSPASAQAATELRILLEQAQRQREPILALLSERSAEAANDLRRDLDQLAEAIRGRQPARDVSGLASAAAQAAELQFPDTDAQVADEAGDRFQKVRSLLAEALVAYRQGKPDAVHLVSDAYFQFEPVEMQLAVVAPDVTREVEARFLELRGVLGQSGGIDRAESLVLAIDGELDKATAALVPRTTPYAAAIQSATIILREGFEVVLIIGALLAYVVKSGNPAMRGRILWGAAAGLLGSALSAYALVEAFQATGAVEALEGVTMLLAAAVLFFVSYWLISKAEADKWQNYIAGRAKTALSRGSGWALAGTAFLAVYREGVETVLFYRALLGSAPDSTGMVASGFAAGSVVLLIVGVLFVRFGLRVPIRQFFFGTSVLLYYLAFVFAGKGIAELQEAGWIAVTPVALVPRIDLLGVYPTAQGLTVQGLFLLCLVYAVVVSLRRRAVSRVQAEEVLAASGGAESV